jgi:hypothetical protein
MKSTLEPISGDPDRLAEAAREAGLTEVVATALQADLGIDDPAAVVAYRLALPHIAEWCTGLDDVRRKDVVDQGVRAVRPLLNDWRPAVVLLSGRA